ncbi:MAG: TIGR02281 family clan AA aspartic protease [Rhizomicrobium sp.]
MLDSPRPSRFLLFLGGLAVFGVGIWLLMRLFPEVSLSNADGVGLVQLAAFGALVGSGVVVSRRFSLGQAARNIAIWVAIAAVLAIGYTLFNASSELGTRLRSELDPAAPVAADAHTLVLTADENGDFAVTGAVDGTQVRFAVDTGASDIVLSPADAARAGVDVAHLRFLGETQTANGTGHTAAVRIASLVLGPAHYADVAALVNQAPMASSLLGMAFLRRFKAFEFRGNKLYLRWN